MSDTVRNPLPVRLPLGKLIPVMHVVPCDARHMADSNLQPIREWVLSSEKAIWICLPKHGNRQRRNPAREEFPGLRIAFSDRFAGSSAVSAAGPISEHFHSPLRMTIAFEIAAQLRPT
jgi:hypothetical protein